MVRNGSNQPSPYSISALCREEITLTQTRLRQHLQKLLLRAHVDRLRHQFAFAIVNETLGDAIDVKEIICLASWIQKDRICHRPLGQEWFDLGYLFIINREDD